MIQRLNSICHNPYSGNGEGIHRIAPRRRKHVRAQGNALDGAGTWETWVAVNVSLYKTHFHRYWTGVR